MKWTWRDDAACRTVGPEIWGAIEASIVTESFKYVGRTRVRRVYNLAMPALQVCSGCPVFAACERWSKEDRYSGVAAGKVLINGVPIGQARRKAVIT